jgi:hypothetical protein
MSEKHNNHHILASFEQAAQLIKQADALIIGAGAGMGWIPDCRIFAVTRAFGTPTPLWQEPNLNLRKWRTRAPSSETQLLRGVFMGID